MEMAIAAIGKVIGGLGLSAAGAGAGAATTAATAATGATAAAGASSGALTALQGFGSALKILGTIGAGMAAANESKQLATEADLQGGQEQVEGQQRQNRIRRELARVLGQNDVTYAAAGIDLSGGIAQEQATTARQRATDEITIDQRDTDFRRALYRQRASGYRQRARSQIGGALIGALGTAADFGMGVEERG
ncbi:MAG: hypothetical protein KUL88_04520 [Rhizobium sp.]|nr:hypothetical protein [Rhizobium sp.]